MNTFNWIVLKVEETYLFKLIDGKEIRGVLLRIGDEDISVRDLMLRGSRTILRNEIKEIHELTRWNPHKPPAHTRHDKRRTSCTIHCQLIN